MPYTSACVIVRNEEENLPRWLKCMRALADELVVVDTGSSDNTVAVAEAAGAKVFHFPWINDFAAAKNYALEKATGKWIFFLDADEYWEEKDVAVIRKTLRQYDKKTDVIGFVCRLVNIDKDNNNRVLNENLHIRIFRNLPWLRYQGAVHEQLVYGGSGTGKKEMKLLPKAVIYHTGYSGGNNIRKAKRNLQILLEMQASGKAQAGDICYIADCYYSLKEYGKAAMAAAKAIESKAVLTGRETRMYCILIQSRHLLGQKWGELLPLVEEAEHVFPYVPDFRALLGFAAWEDGAKTEARQFFRESKVLYREFLAHRQDVTATYPDEMPGFLPRMEACLTAETNAVKITSGSVKISAAVITKNEEKDLPHWLQCMQNLADEMVVVDTGSTDRTVEIAKAAGARVEYFDWIDDFAAAKNFAIDCTRGEWILLLDADEYIPEEDYGGVQTAIAQYDKDKNVIGMACTLINIDAQKNNAYINQCHQIRVFRRLPDLRYIGSIHELLQYSGEGKKTMPYVDDFRIYHTGYSPMRMPEKYKRNLRMLQASIKKYGMRPGDEVYLADCYFGIEEYEEAIKYAKLYLDGRQRTGGLGNRPYGIWIQSLIRLKRPLEEITGIVDKARREFPYLAEFKMLEGYAREEREDFPGAEVCYWETVKIYTLAKEKDIWKKQLVTDEVGRSLPQLYANLCRLLLWQGRMAEAWDVLQKALAMDKYHPMVCRLLGKFLADKDDLTWIEVFNSIYDKVQDAAFILAHLPPMGRDKVRLYYRRQQDDQDKLVENYMLAGRLKAAGAALTEDTATLLQLGIRSFAHDMSSMEKIGVLMPQSYRAVTIGKATQSTEKRLARRTARIQSWLGEWDGLA